MGIGFAAMNLGLAVFLAAGTLGVALEFYVGNRNIAHLATIPKVPRESAPSVAIVVAARNESRNLREAMTSLLQLDYPHYRIVLVNDRSTDDTGEIAEALAREHDHLQVVHVDHLPAGWLGKNHALYTGVQASESELILFTDADIVMRPDALSRAVGYLESRGLGLLAVSPKFTTVSRLLALFYPHFTVSFALYAHPWKVSDPENQAHVGIGAFNLMPRVVYQAVGTHQALALRPDDDVKLGKRVKAKGYAIDMLFGHELIGVEWYASLNEAIEGLMKNAFAGLEYNAPYALLGSFLQFFAFTGPWLGALLSLALGQWGALGFYALAILFQSWLAWDNAPFHGLSRKTIWATPLAAALMSFIILKSMVRTLRQQGIYWRGTFYPLDELRRNRV